MATKKRTTEKREYNVTVKRVVTSNVQTTVDVLAHSWNEARRIANKEARDYPGRFDWTEV